MINRRETAGRCTVTRSDAVAVWEGVRERERERVRARARARARASEEEHACERE